MRTQLKLARKAAGLSQEKIARLCGISQQAYGSIEHGRSNPSYDTAFKIWQTLQKDAPKFDLFLDDFSLEREGKSVQK